MFNHFDLWGHQVHLYNVFMCLGIIAGALSLDKRISQSGIETELATRIRFLVAVSIPAGLFFGYLSDRLFIRGGEFTLSSLLNFSSGGFTFLGGLLGAMVMSLLFCIVFRLPFLFLMNLVIPSIVLGHSFGRIGCFLAGCCFGKPTVFFGGVRFPEGSLPYQAFGDQHLHPTQLYEAIFLAALYFLLLRAGNRSRFWIYLAGYGIARFLLEYLRADTRGTIPGISVLTPSQVISLIFGVFGVAGLFLFRRENGKLS